ncbi:MAG: hypothetical protein IPP47_23015 [Bryobacterales bacterium]|nr:hypothetical protein [Bryobacterales bacterium]
MFHVKSRYSEEMGDVESTVDALQAKVAAGEATERPRRTLKALERLSEARSGRRCRRADTSHVSKISGRQEEFAQSLLRELRSLKGAEPNEKA